MIIYLTENLTNEKLYIGQTVRDDNTYLGSGLLIQRAIDKYGRENFKRVILIECSSQEELNEQEIFWIQTLNTLQPNGYNLELGGNGKGKVSKETLKKMSNAKIGKFKSEETKKKMKQHKKTNQHKKRISESNLDWWKNNKNSDLVEKRNKKVSEACKGRIPWNKNKKIPHKIGCKCPFCISKRNS